MAKVRINGESFDFDGSKAPLSEALEIERILKMRYAQWESELSQGSMQAMAAFVWKVWHRDGRNVSLQDIVDGKVEVELNDLLESLMEVAREAEQDAEGPKAEAPAGTGSAPAGSATTRKSTSRSSPASSG